MAVSLVVFDMDDTLYLERDYVRSGFHAVAEVLSQDYEIVNFEDGAWAAFLSGERGTIFDTTLRALTGEAPRPLVERCIDVYRTHRPNISLLPDARSFVTWCNTRFSTAVVTDGPAASQRAKVTVLGLRSHVDRVILTDEMGSGWAKPSASSFRLLENEMGHAGEDCVYLGDNPAKDFVGPRQLGWRTVRVRRRDGLHEHVTSDLDASIVVGGLGNDSLNSLDDIFGQVPQLRPTDQGVTS